MKKKKPNEDVIQRLFKIRSKRNKPFFDSKTQLDLNCLWISALVAASEILPEKGYLNLAEEFFSKVEKVLYISYSD